jgi:hypothetical protein
LKSAENQIRVELLVIDFGAREECHLEKKSADSLVRYRVPMSWALGLLALALARPTPQLLALGVPIGAFGQALRLWAAGYLKKNEGVTRSGPYAMTRNPLYLGSSIMGLGFVVASGRWELAAVLVVLVVGIFLPVMKTEARNLEQRFSSVYTDYAKAVPLFFPRYSPQTQRQPFSWKLVRRNREHVTVMGWLGVVVLLGLKMFLSS